MSRCFVVLGAGRFGQLAVTRLADRHGAGAITVVDDQPDERAFATTSAIQSVRAEGIDYLSEQLPRLPPESIIVPAIPVHVAFEWLLRDLAPDGPVERAPVPDDLGLPNESTGPTGDRYVSYADFLCPDDCPEPKNACPVTRTRRGTPMHRRIAELSCPTLPVHCIRSEQLAPGVGGYAVARLLELRQTLAGLAGTALVGTACSCHGVVSALRRLPSKSTA